VSAPAIELIDVGKRYVKYEDTPTLTSSILRFRSGNRRSSLWAIRHVDLVAAPGESIGVIGRNGSGKSTTLRMLAGVTGPTEGVLRVRGRVAPLISVGVGFHPELTGRENVYVNGTVLGLSKREIDQRFDQIVDFAEVENFIDTPTKFYSSGMFVRLGFAVAVASRPDVLLVDEVLAVGDLAFQMKCYARMKEMQLEGTAMFIVSHNIAAVRNMSDQVLLLHDGRPRFFGDNDEAISLYHQLLWTDPTGDAPVGQPAEILEFQLLGSNNEQTAHIRSGEPATFQLKVRFLEAVRNPDFSLLVTTADGQPVYADNTFSRGNQQYAEGDVVTCAIRMQTRLATGNFAVRAGVRIGQSVETARDVIAEPLHFYVSGRPLARGMVDLEAVFDVGGPAAAAEPEPGAAASD
jgi:ABC-type polysaccharide/polyol phosphate transport system ATPase subunit